MELVPFRPHGAGAFVHARGPRESSLDGRAARQLGGISRAERCRPRVPIGSVMLWRSTLLHAVAPHTGSTPRVHLYYSFIPRFLRPSAHTQESLSPDLLGASPHIMWPCCSRPFDLIGTHLRRVCNADSAAASRRDGGFVRPTRPRSCRTHVAALVPERRRGRAAQGVGGGAQQRWRSRGAAG